MIVSNGVEQSKVDRKAEGGFWTRTEMYRLNIYVSISFIDILTLVPKCNYIL